MKRLLEAISHWLKRVVTQPREELDRWQTAARFGYDLGRFGARQLQNDRATQMAAALAFRTLFGLLPVLVVATVLVKALGMQEHYLGPLDKLFEFWGLDQVKIVPPTEIGQAASVPLSNWLRDRVREAEQVNFAAIGWVGVAVTIYAAISLMVTIEECFNIIYRAAQGRPWTSRVPVYWFLLTLSPLLIVVGNHIDTRFQDLLAGSHAPQWVLTGLTWLWSTFVIWLLMGAVYTLFPNAKVHLRPAMIGALVAAVLLEIGKRTMGLYLQNALSLSQLYGSLGLIPLFMFWVYLMWLAVLFGLQVSSTLQQLHGRDLTELPQGTTAAAEMVDPNWVIVMMQQAAQRFRAGRAADVEEMAGAAGLPEPLAQHVVDALVAERLLHRLAEPEGSIALARPPEEIRIEALLAVAHGLTQHPVDDPRTAELLKSLQRVQRENAARLSLASLLA